MPMVRDMDNSPLAFIVTVVRSGGVAVHRSYLLMAAKQNLTCSIR